MATTQLPSDSGVERRLSRVEQVYRKIKESILSNEFPAGFQALEPELAARLGVSRTPVREALIRLSADGLVQLIPRRGMKVLSLSVLDLREIFQVLCSLETQAVALLLRSNGGAEVERLPKCVADMQAALERKSLGEWLDAEAAFEDTLTLACGNQRLHQIAQGLREQIVRVRKLTVELRSDLQHYTLELREICALIQAGRAEATSRYSAHCQTSLDNFVATLQKYKLEAI